MGKANIQGQLWGTRARDWAEVQEGVAIPLYRAVLNKTAIGVGTSVLDIGCGSGIFCEMAAKRGIRFIVATATARRPWTICTFC